MKKLFQGPALIIIVSIASIAGIAFAYSHRTTEKKVGYLADAASSSPVTLIASTLADKDSDNDGLKDWEESLWDTDPNNADTDGDKTFDGVEVKINRNPLVKGPNDSLDNFPINAAATSSEETLTKTDMYSREIFARYLKLKEDGDGLTDEEQTALIDDLLAGIDQVKEEPKSYSAADMTITRSTSIESHKEYANNISRILSANSVTSSTYEVAILVDLLSKNDQSGIGKFDQSIANYTNMINKMLDMPVPADLADIHIQLVNSFSHAQKDIEGFKVFIKDPIVTMASFQDYMKAMNTATQTMTELRGLLANEGITL